MSTATAVKPIELHEKTAKASQFFQDNMTLDQKAKTLTPADEAYQKILADISDVPLAMAKALHQADQHIIAGFADAVTTMANAGAKKHKDLDVVDATLPMIGRSRFDVHYIREREVNAGIPKDGQPAEKKTVYGTFQTKLVVEGTDTGSGELNKVGKRSKAAAMEMFGKK